MNDDRAREALEHLQRAAHELIAAARAVLDVADDLVSDPSSATEVVNGLSGLASMARLAGFPGFSPGPPRGADEDAPADDQPHDQTVPTDGTPPTRRRAPSTKVRRIRVS